MSSTEVNYSQFKARERAQKQAARPFGSFSVDKANAMGGQMLANMHNYINSAGKSAQALLRDKGQLAVDQMRTMDSKYAKVIRENTGVNVPQVYGPDREGAILRPAVRAGSDAVNALMNSKRVKKATGVVTDFLGTEYNPEDRTAVAATAARYVIPLTGAGIALAGLAGMMGGDEQEQGQLTIQ